jgi:hypothetical protein
VHALRNVTSKLPERHHTEVKSRWWKIFDEAASPAEARADWTRSSPTTAARTHRQWR